MRALTALWLFHRKLMLPSLVLTLVAALLSMVFSETSGIHLAGFCKFNS